MKAKEEIILALEDKKAGESLYNLACSFKSDGMTKDEMYNLFDSFRQKHETDIDEVKYNNILDTMDYISGFCDKTKSIF